MTDEEIRVAIAEGLGWIHVKIDHRIASKCDRNTSRGHVGIPPVNQMQEGGKDPLKDYNYWLVPNYTTDLNVIAEAEKQYMRRGMGLADHIYLHLKAVCGDDECDAAFASAQQRCEALLRAMGLWEEDWDVDQTIHPFITESSKFNTPCAACNGVGWLKKFPSRQGKEKEQTICPSCNGNGLRRDEKPEPKRL